MRSINLSDFDGDLYLIQYGETSYLLGRIKDAPTDTATIKEYNYFVDGVVENCICLNHTHPFSDIDIRGIKSIRSIDKITRQVQEELKIDLNDYVMPFIGGIINFDWREIYKRFFALEPKSIYDYEKCYKEYLKEVIETNSTTRTNPGER